VVGLIALREGLEDESAIAKAAGDGRRFRGMKFSLKTKTLATYPP
jgi:hypothetical protein